MYTIVYQRGKSLYGADDFRIFLLTLILHIILLFCAWASRGVKPDVFTSDCTRAAGAKEVQDVMRILNINLMMACAPLCIGCTFNNMHC
jgi:hypothetical protein